jgi:hypothetical protein
MTNNANVDVDYTSHLGTQENPYMASVINTALDNLYDIPEMKVIMDELKARGNGNMPFDIRIEDLSYTGGTKFSSTDLGFGVFNRIITIDSNQLAQFSYSYDDNGQTSVQKMSVEEVLAHEILHAVQDLEARRNTSDPAHEEMVVNTIDMLRTKYWGLPPRDNYLNGFNDQNIDTSQIDWTDNQTLGNYITTFADPANSTGTPLNYGDIDWGIIVHKDAANSSDNTGAFAKLWTSNGSLILQTISSLNIIMVALSIWLIRIY